MVIVVTIKNIDDRNCLKPVNPKCVLSQMMCQKKTIPPKSPRQKGSFTGRRGGRAYVEVCVED